jgi:hypothetical protein
MAISTEIIEFCSKHVLWVPNKPSGTFRTTGQHRRAMEFAGAVASLATYSQLMWLELASRTDGNRSSRMAFEAFQHPSLRIERLV